MRRLAPYVICLALVVPAVANTACATSGATVRTDPTVIAQRALQIVKVLDVVVDGLIAGRDAGWVSPQVVRAIELDIQTALVVIRKTPDGARAAAIAVLRAAQSRVGSDGIKPWLVWGVTAVEALP